MRTTILISKFAAIGFRRPSILLLAIALTYPLATACRTSVSDPNTEVVVNSPASGVVRRVLVDEGTSVEKDSAIIEIAIQRDQATASQTNKPTAEQALAARAAEANLVSSEAEANRTAAELQRIEPLVKRGMASKAELEKARAQSLDAQERLRLAREKAQSAGATSKQPTTINPIEEIVTVRVPSAGTVRALTIQAGQQVTAGERLATLVSHT